MIITFYSYKGGVGRSMALANVAEHCRRKGLRVAMLDWDLEAPGLEEYFWTEPHQLDRVRAQRGIVDLLLEYLEAHARLGLPPFSDEDVEEDVEGGNGGPDGRAREAAAPAAAREEARQVLRARLRPLPESLVPVRASEGAGAGGLWLLPAGLRLGNAFPAYAQSVQTFDWGEFYASYHGEEYFDWMREQLTGFADVVLIDSRTGVTEMSGVCARQLADVVVSFCAPNRQNLEGVVQMSDSFAREEVLAMRGERPLELIIVPTRLDNSETNLRASFERTFREVSARFIPRSFQRVESDFLELGLPYVPKYAYGEQLVVGDPDANGELEKAYRTLCAHLALLAPERSRMREAFTPELTRAFRAVLPRTAVVGAPSDGSGGVERLRALLAEAGVGTWEDFPGLASGTALASGSASEMAPVDHLVILLPPGPDGWDAMRAEWLAARRMGVCLHVVLPPDVTLAGALRWVDGKRCVPLAEAGSTLARRLNAPCTEVRVPHLVPGPPTAAQPRPDPLEQLVGLLENGGDTTDVVLTALGGAGKTTLAQLACHDDRVIAAYRGGIYWIDLAAEPALMPHLQRIFTARTGRRLEAASEAAATDEMRRALGSDPSLLVLDDVPDEEALQPFLWWQQGGRLLVISRRRMVLRGNKAVILNGLSPHESLDLLLVEAGTRLPHPQTEAAVPLLEELAGRLNHWPLALRLAAGNLRERLAFGQTLAAAVREVLEGVSADGGDGTRTALALQDVVKTAVDDLTPADRVRLLHVVHRTGQNGATLTELEHAWGGEEIDLTAAALRLASSHLLEFDAARKSVRIHPLVLSSLRALYPDAPPPAELAPRPIAELAAEARALLSATGASTEALVAHARLMEGAGDYAYARRLLRRAREQAPAESALRLAQLEARCTYKDPELGAWHRFDRALEILDQADPLASTTDQETLGLAGAILKRRWEVEGHPFHLERAFAYYYRGYAQGPESDHGYTGINAAYCLDILASLERRDTAAAGGAPLAAAQRAETARRIRRHLAEAVPALLRGPEGKALLGEWWLLVTVGEAYLGLRWFDQARAWLTDASLLNVPDWQRASTARQLANLVRLMGEEDPVAAEEAWEVLAAFLGDEAVALRSVAIGRIGLALSGGGFRASLFHVGVLARLAELDILRHVEVISCVSGGSIIGAHYYLELRRLLQTKPDRDVTREDYVQVVRKLERDFLAGVQRNLRVRALRNPIVNLKMLFRPGYSRTDRIGELFESEIFSRVADGEAGGRWLDGLVISPAGERADFSPVHHNWRRSAKVPALVLNATTLNTGNNWQFTPSWMGEPPWYSNQPEQGDFRLDRVKYADAPAEHQRVRLGRAVAASACVPGLFAPVTLAGLYPGRTVRLVDGGVHDNQGVASLLEQDCAQVLVSDASGQISGLDAPPRHAWSVPLRSNTILQARVRDAQYRDLRARRRSGALQGMMAVHLKQELGGTTVPVIDSLDPFDPTEASGGPAEGGSPLTRYSIRRDIQARLAAIRTDLDSFCDAEAHALMLSGYRLADQQFSRSGLGLPGAPSEPENWTFRSVEREMRGDAGVEARTRWLMRVLDVARSRALKAFRLSPESGAAAAVVSLAAAGGLYWLTAWIWYAIPGNQPVRLLSMTAVIALLSCILVSAAVALHLLLVDRHYLRLGRSPTWLRRPWVLRWAPSMALMAGAAGVVWVATHPRPSVDSTPPAAGRTPPTTSVAGNRLPGLDSLVASNPDAADARVARGEELLSLGRYGAALADLDRAIELAPGSLRAYALRADARLALADSVGALRDLRVLHDRGTGAVRNSAAERLRALGPALLGTVDVDLAYGAPGLDSALTEEIGEALVRLGQPPIGFLAPRNRINQNTFRYFNPADSARAQILAEVLREVLKRNGRLRPVKDSLFDPRGPGGHFELWLDNVTSPATARGRISVFVRPGSEPGARQLRARMEELGYTDIAIVTQTGPFPGTPDIRFYHSQDRESAELVRTYLDRAGIRLRLNPRIADTATRYPPGDVHIYLGGP